MRNVSRLIVLASALVMATSASGQLKKPGVTLGVSAFYASPQGDMKDAYKGGLGGEIKGGVGLGDTYIVATLGYGGFATRSGNNTGTLTVKPMKLGIKQYFLMKRLFVNGDIGVALLKNKNLSESRFSSDIGAGVRLIGMEFSIYYDSWKNLSGSGTSGNVQYKVGYNFTL